MKISMISFTKKGRQLSEKLAKGFRQLSEVQLFTKYKSYLDEVSACEYPVHYVEESVSGWAGSQMREKNALLFIGACGIAVRAVAPHLTDKLHDSPVLVMDECGKYVIPVLSGHMGGANELAVRLAGIADAVPVITTATDCSGRFAVDLFAKKNGLAIVNKDGIAKVSAKALAGKMITISIDSGCEHYIKWESSALEDICTVPYPPASPVDVLVTSEENTFDTALWLKPKEYVIGMGCKKGKPLEDIDRFIAKKLSVSGISKSQVYALASISQKRGELGIVQWCQREGIIFLTYTAEELQAVEGDFAKSSFVGAQVGVDNVCERAAVKACGAGAKLVLKKCAEDGMTVAVAKRQLPPCDDSSPRIGGEA